MNVGWSLALMLYIYTLLITSPVFHRRPNGDQRIISVNMLTIPGYYCWIFSWPILWRKVLGLLYHKKVCVCYLSTKKSGYLLLILIWIIGIILEYDQLHYHMYVGTCLSVSLPQPTHPQINRHTRGRGVGGGREREMQVVFERCSCVFHLRRPIIA
jgi:hypothetical protein